MTRKSSQLRSVGAVLRFFRKCSGLSQEKLAERLGVSTNYISVLETGKQYPSIGTLIKFAFALGVPPGELVNEIAKREGMFPHQRVPDKK